MKRLITSLALIAAVVGLAPPAVDAAQTVSLVYINGRATRVYFSDGDSFRQLEGPWNGRNSRLGGFNTLESFGAAHSWGTWHPYELWVNAKQATLNAREGVWHCSGDGSTDTYGRVLLDCPDLAISQIRQGFAHAMNVDDSPSRPEYLRAQHEAIRERRGMWAHGVPGFILTSLHSNNENPTRDIQYNRMVSTRDGHSERWQHNDFYPECSWQCTSEIYVDEDIVRAAARGLRENPATREAVADLSNILLIEAVDRYARLAELPEYLEDNVRDAIHPVLRVERSEGRLGTPQERIGACMIYADFLRRYGRNRASCFFDHGTHPPHLEGTWER